VLECILSLLAAVGVFFRSRTDMAIEVLALRQQVAVLKRKRPRPTLNSGDRLFWTTLCAVWCRWADVLVIVKPETVIGWHRAGFRLYWRWRSRPLGGRPRITVEIRVLIRRLAHENPDWGSPKIHGELQKLGFVVSERTVARYLRRLHSRGNGAKRWLAFLQNHREAIVAFDFFTVPTLTFQLLYCFFVIEHGRRKILHCNVTRHPTADWVIQQPREAFPETGPYRYVILDRDSKFDLTSYALWNYLATPFLLAGPGFETEEIAPHEENGETWRRLAVRFPAGIPTHSPAQTFYFGQNGLLHRLDYDVDIAGGAPGAHYCFDHTSFGGIVVPTLRRVVTRSSKGADLSGPTGVLVRISDVVIQ
jgi:hypothetical protein